MDSQLKASTWTDYLVSHYLRKHCSALFCPALLEWLKTGEGLVCRMSSHGYWVGTSSISKINWWRLQRQSGSQECFLLFQRTWVQSSAPVSVVTVAFWTPESTLNTYTQSYIIKNRNLKKDWQVSSFMEFGLFTVKWSYLTLIALGLRLSNPHSHWLLPARDSGMCQEACTAKPGSFVACYFTTLKIKVFKWFPTWNLVEVNSE